MANTAFRAVHHSHIDAARRFAAADKSDPFAYGRAMAHLRSGLAGYDARGNSCFYDAEEATETRKLPDGTEYQARVYRNVVRP